MGDLTLDEVEQLRALLDDYKTALANNTAFGGIAKDARVNTSLSTFAVDMDVMFVLLCGYLVFFMQGGFAMLSVGAVRAKNVKNILLYILMDATIGAICWYLLGYGFAFGDKIDSSGNNIGNGFIGNTFFAMNPLAREQFHTWFFQYTFAATATTIVSGAVIERTKVNAYVVYSMFLTSFVYPVVAHWEWSPAGWLCPYRAESAGKKLFNVGMVDFAGCGAIHMVGGLSGIVGAHFVGPRIGRYNSDGTANPMPGHNTPFAALGTLMLWFGWYGFNGGSAGQIVATSVVISRIACNTTLGGAAGGMGALLFSIFVDKTWDVTLFMNGILAGLVSITGGCHVFEPWAAIAVGCIGGWVFPLASRLLTKMRIDDPLEAGAMHGGCGMWGLLSVGFLAERTSIEFVYGGRSTPGAFYRDGHLLAAQVVGICVITGWSVFLMGCCFFALKKFNMLRIAAVEEQQGMDISYHGGTAYPDEGKTEQYIMNIAKEATTEVFNTGGDDSNKGF